MKKYIAEFIGTFILVFCGTGAIVINEATSGTITHSGIAFTFGLTVMIVIYSIGKISGAHINPAVTFTLWANKKIDSTESIKYVMSQLSGAILASIVVSLLFRGSEYLGATFPAGSSIQCFIIEFILSFILMFVIKQMESQSITWSGFAIGAVVGLEALFAGPVTGASMNPARSIAPALVSGHLDFIWIYIFAPLAGMLLGNFISSYLKRQRQ